ncbi:MAG: methylmalonyl-CoA mutase [Elusimicrobia bacterium]|nr:methylmalonyl-CoA mutase [Elusimicrobiota bacterium]
MGDFALKDKPVFGRAGEYPYTRGIHPDMYTKGNLPTVRKYGGFGSCGELNQHLKQQIALGVTGLSIAYDLPTQMGFDPDHSMALGEVGVNGVSVSSSKDYEEAFHGLFPEIISKGIGVSKTINATAPILLAFYVAAAKRQGVDPKELRGTIQNDVLKEYLSRNTFIYPLAGTLRLARDVFGWCKSELPRFNTISICGYHMREKGCTASQELAYMFSNAIEYLVTGVAGGLKIEEIASQVSFFINVKKNLFEEAAKLRAARRIWAQIIKEGFGVDHERSQKLRMQSYTGGSDLIKQKPQLNIVRDAVRTLAAVLGGPQGTNTTSFDEAITIPTALSQQIAIDTPYIILLEKALAQTVDPFGGSSYLEFLTDKIEAEVWSELDLISRCRTYQEALARMHRTLEDEAYREQKAEDSGQKKVAGKNWAKDNEKLYPSVPLFSPPGDPAKREKERLAAFRDFKAKRGREHYGQALRELKSAAQQPDLNLMPRILECAQSGATLGEISDALREAFGTADPSAPWEPSKPVEVFNGQLRGYLAKKAISFSSLRGVSYSVIASGAEAPRGNLIQGNSLHEIASPEARNDRIPFRFWKPIHHSRTHALTHSN